MAPYSRAPPLLDLALEGVARLVAASISTTTDHEQREGPTHKTRHAGDVWPLNTISREGPYSVLAFCQTSPTCLLTPTPLCPHAACSPQTLSCTWPSTWVCCPGWGTWCWTPWPRGKSRGRRCGPGPTARYCCYYLNYHQHYSPCMWWAETPRGGGSSQAGAGAGRYWPG